MSRLLTALSIEGPDGVDVPILRGDRKVRVTKASGLVGLKAREAVGTAPGRHGTLNRTRFRDDRQPTFTLLFVGATADEAWDEYDQVARAVAGAVDADRLLKWRAGDNLDLQTRVRLVELDDPVEPGPSRVACQLVLRASDPYAYSQVERSGTAPPLGGSSAGGDTLTAPPAHDGDVFPDTFLPLGSSGVTVTNDGAVPSPPLIELQGRLLNPIVRLADRQLVLDGEIFDGQTLRLDAAAKPRTIVLDGVADRMGMLRAGVSRWFELPVGTSTVQLLADAWSANAGMTIRWRDAR